ncbi:hypothetical protein SGLAM104S_05484 [Streptomyces glaucescens]
MRVSSTTTSPNAFSPAASYSSFQSVWPEAAEAPAILPHGRTAYALSYLSRISLVRWLESSGTGISVFRQPPVAILRTWKARPLAVRSAT